MIRLFDIFFTTHHEALFIGASRTDPSMIQPATATRLTLLCAGFLSACQAPGTLWVNGEATPLRTVLVRADETEGATRATVVLSNGLFGCRLPQLDDPARAQQAVQNMITAACREGAVHLNLTLWRTPDGTWTGAYPGVAYGGPLDLGPEQPRLSDAIYYSVEEAILVEYVSLDRAYAVEAATYAEGAGAGGRVDIAGDDGSLWGSVNLPSLGLNGQFDAEWCEAEDNQFALIESSPAFVCP